MSSKYAKNMAVGPQITGAAPKTVLQVFLDDKVATTTASSTLWYQTVVGFFPKGPSGKVVTLSNGNVETKLIKKFGKATTLKNGVSTTYARKFAQDGWSLQIINVRPADAECANLVYAFQLEPVEKTIYIDKDTGTNKITIRPELQTGLTQTEVKYMGYKVGFIPTALAKVFDYSEFKEKLEASVDCDTAKYAQITDFSTITDFKVNIPVFGICYQGSGTAANNYFSNITFGEMVNDSYPQYTMQINEGDNQILNIDFTLANINVSGYPSRIDAVIDMHGRDADLISHVVSDKDINKSVDGMKLASKISLTNMAKAIKAVESGFDENDPSASNFNDYVLGNNAFMNTILYDTSAAEEVTDENAFSFVNFLQLMEINNTTYDYQPVESSNFSGGTWGSLTGYLRYGFDWDLEVELQASSISGEIYNPFNTSARVLAQAGIRAGIGSRDSGVKVKPFVEMFISAFTGGQTPEIYDPAKVRDSFLFAVEMPDEVQKAAIDLSYVMDNTYHNDKRPDFTVIACPNHDTKNLQQVDMWSKKYMNENRNLFKMIGRMLFTDITTDKPRWFDATYDFSKTLLPALTSLDKNSYAGRASAIYTNLTSEPELVPASLTECDSMSASCVNYLTYFDSIKTWVLGDDNTNIPGFETSVKRLKYDAYFNKAINIAYNILTENAVHLANASNWGLIEKEIKNKWADISSAFLVLDIKLHYDEARPSDVNDGKVTADMYAAFEKIARYFKLNARTVSSASYTTDGE